MGYFSRTAQPGTAQHLAEHCTDDGCTRLPCRMFKAGYARGYQDGLGDGYTAGYSDGYIAGYSAASASG
jgi:hypothetical protein